MTRKGRFYIKKQQIHGQGEPGPPGSSMHSILSGRKVKDGSIPHKGDTLGESQAGLC